MADAQNAGSKKAIYRTALILTALTALEFLIAFTVPAGFLKVAVFVGLTIVKAFYIVAEFMHLGHEMKRLIWSILLPFLFIIWLLVAMMKEGSYWGELSNPGKSKVEKVEPHSSLIKAEQDAHYIRYYG